jgi:hypothetical protein
MEGKPVEIDVQRINETTFQVGVGGRKPTVHTVSIPQAYYEKLTGGRASPELLVERSFEFLLEREPNTSILRRFELSVIQTYFPEYEESMKTLLA